MLNFEDFKLSQEGMTLAMLYNNKITREEALRLTKWDDVKLNTVWKSLDESKSWDTLNGYLFRALEEGGKRISDFPTLH